MADDDRAMVAAMPPPPGFATLVPGAGTLPDDLLDHLTRSARERVVPADTLLLRQRAVVTELLVLVEGTVSTLVAFGGVGDLVVETTSTPGRVYGWSGLLPPGRAVASARADTACRLLVVDLAVLSAERPRWRAALAGLLAATLADRARDLQTVGVVDPHTGGVVVPHGVGVGVGVRDARDDDHDRSAGGP